MTTATKVVKSELKLYQAIAGASIAGCVIQPGRFIEREYDGATTRVCLCGSVLRATGFSESEIEVMDGEDIIKNTAKKLGITLKQAASLNNGFEDYDSDTVSVAGAFFFPVNGKEVNPLRKGTDKHWFEIGKKLRSVYDDNESY